MRPAILFPASTSAAYLPDSAFAEEAEHAQEAGFEVGYVSLDMMFGADVTIRKLPDGEGPVLYRGWILKEGDYARLEEAIQERGRSLVTPTTEYTYAYHFPRWYEDLAGNTPQSIWVYQGPEMEAVVRDTVLPPLLTRLFGDGAGAIVKDFVKSRKHEWWDACYIPDVGDTHNVMRVVNNFLQRQEEYLIGGLVVREYVRLRQIGIHTKSRLPLVNEHRFFLLNGQVLYQAPYWGEGDYSGLHPDENVVREALKVMMPKDPSRKRASFVAVDVAELDEGGWTIVEVNDGGTSGIPAGGDSRDFYRRLFSVYSE